MGASLLVLVARQRLRCCTPRMQVALPAAMPLCADRPSSLRHPSPCSQRGSVTRCLSLLPLAPACLTCQIVHNAIGLQKHPKPSGPPSDPFPYYHEVRIYKLVTTKGLNSNYGVWGALFGVETTAAAVARSAEGRLRLQLLRYYSAQPGSG